MAKKRYGTPRSTDPVLGAPSLEIILGTLDRIPGTYAAVVASYLRDGQYKSATELKADPRDCDNSDEYALRLLAVSLIRKYPGFPGSSSKSAEAISKWLACEETCRETNDRIKLFRIGQARPDLAYAFSIARSKISKILGPFRWSRPARFFNFGPGSTTRLPRRKRFLPYKYGERPETTFDNLASAHAVISMSPVWSHSSGGRINSGCSPCFSIRESSKITTVPKDAFIDRVIAIEPDMNMFIQKGFGGFIRHRLKRVGINLDDQSLNQLLARQGSLGSLATIDLSSASDTISYELVKELLPPDWFEALLSCRTHSSLLPSGEVLPLQKFSSMGNGFTFELESLLFYSLCSAVCKVPLGREGLRVSVFGDDIVVSVEDFPQVIDILEFSGFSANLKKTYAEGPYRESCGKHYFHGHDVTPITITKEIHHASKLLLLCNNLVRWSTRITGGLYRSKVIFDAYTFCVEGLPQHLRRKRLPDGFGDGALIGSFTECRPKRCRRGWDGYRVTGVLQDRSKYRHSNGVATLAAALATLESSKQLSPPENTFYPVYTDIGGPRFEESCLYDKPSFRVYGRDESFGNVQEVFLGLSGQSPSALGPNDLRRISRNRARLDRRDASCWRVMIDEDFPLVSGRGVTFLEHDTVVKTGSVFIEQWCDIGPWL